VKFANHNELSVSITSEKGNRWQSWPFKHDFSLRIFIL